MKQVRFNVDLPRNLYTQLRIKSIEIDRSMADITRKALMVYLNGTDPHTYSEVRRSEVIGQR